MGASINVFRNNGAWRYALYIDGDLSRLGDLGVADEATEAAAMDAACKMCVPSLGDVTVTRVADPPSRTRTLGQDWRGCGTAR
jgi:hypothetical protein